MQLTLIRHTSVDVPKGICYGIFDVPVSSSFPEEAAMVKQRLANKTFDAVYSSPKIRCTKLASEIFPEAEIKLNNFLCEIDFGAWEMVRWNSIYETKKGKEWFADYVNTSCLNGESFTDLIKRCESFLELLKQSNHPNIAVFTHAGIIRAMISINQEIAPEDTFYVPVAYGQIVDLNFNQ